MIFSLSSGVFAQTSTYRVSERQIQTLLDRIENRTNAFRDEIDGALDNSSANGTIREDSINSMVTNFENATNRLKENFASRRSTANGVQEVLNRAVQINTFAQNNRMTQAAQSQWNQIRTDLDTLAGYYSVRTNWNYDGNSAGTGTGSFVNDRQLRNLLDNLKVRGSAFRQSFDRWASYNRRDQSGSTENVSQNISEFERAVERLSRNYRNRNSGNANVEQVLRPSASINSFIASNRTSRDVSNKWNLVRNDLNTLAGYYRVSLDWNNTGFPGDRYGGFDSRLTGTYRLNTAQSDNVREVVDRVFGNASYDENQGDRMRRNLERRLLSPETLSIEKRGQQVTMSSANAPRVTINSDGVAQTETSPNGRTVTVSATATNSELTINYQGDRMNDYYVSFTPMNNRQLRVTRRVYLENQDQTVTVASVYDKTSQTPEWNTADYTYTGSNSINRFLIPNNTSIVATLDRSLSTRTVRDGDRFSMTVTSPSEYQGAIIEGNVLGQKSGVVSGRANMSLSFDTIRMRDGRTYRFAGMVEQVRKSDGDAVNVNNEGAVRDSNQTTKTITRAGIGAVLGAVIGAIAGGGQGAAIGAGVGAGAGAGTVILQGRDNLELPSGSEFTITAASPSNVASNR